MPELKSWGKNLFFFIYYIMKYNFILFILCVFKTVRLCFLNNALLFNSFGSYSFHCPKQTNIFFSVTDLNLFAEADGFMLLWYALCARTKWSCGQIITSVKNYDSIQFIFLTCEDIFSLYVAVFFF